MFENVFAAIGFSDGEDAFLGCLGGLKDLGTRRATVACCLDVPDLKGVREHVAGIVGAELEAKCEAVRAGGLEARSEVLIGDPAARFAESAEKHGCGLMVVGARTQSLLGETFIGGAAHTVLSHARLPVLVLRLREEGGTAACRDWPCNALQTILYPTDFSDNGEHALATVKKMAACSKARVVLLHVQASSGTGDERTDRAEELDRLDRERLGRIAEDFRQAGVSDVVVELRAGDPAREIVAYAGEQGVSCIVMGSQGRGFFGELAIGSVSHKTARHVPVPVLLVPAV